MLAPRSLHHESERPSIAALLRGVVEDVQLLARAEVNLARAEVADKVHKLVRPVALVGVAALLGLVVVFTLTGAAVGFLTPYVGAGWAALIVAGVLGLGAFLCLQAGLKGFGAVSIAPKRAVASVKADVAAVKGSVS